MPVDAAVEPTRDEPLRVCVVGAGPWAQLVHAPMLAGHPRTTLAGIWARRADAADELAARHASRGFESLDDLFGACDAVAFAVPPDVQADLATRAARAGKAVLLEKPIALDIEAAERLADAVGEARVGSLVLALRLRRARHLGRGCGRAGRDHTGRWRSLQAPSGWRSLQTP
jgi:predicted dehydrogenase